MQSNKKQVQRTRKFSSGSMALKTSRCKRKQLTQSPIRAMCSAAL